MNNSNSLLPDLNSPFLLDAQSRNNDEMDGLKDDLLSQVLLSSQSEYWALFDSSNQFMKSSALSSMLPTPSDSHIDMKTTETLQGLSYQPSSSMKSSVNSELYYPSPCLPSSSSPSMSLQRSISLDKTSSLPLDVRFHPYEKTDVKNYDLHSSNPKLLHPQLTPTVMASPYNLPRIMPYYQYSVRDETPPSNPIEKAKLTHKDAERRRRDMLSNSFKKLQSRIPGTNIVPPPPSSVRVIGTVAIKPKDPSRVDILEAASLFIDQLQESLVRKDADIKRLKDLLMQQRQYPSQPSQPPQQLPVDPSQSELQQETHYPESS